MKYFKELLRSGGNLTIRVKQEKKNSILVKELNYNGISIVVVKTFCHTSI